MRRTVGVEVSDSTVSRMLKRLGWSRKKIGGCALDAVTADDTRGFFEYRGYRASAQSQ